MGILTPDQRGFLLALARRIVPESSALTPAEQGAFLELVDDGLSERPESVQRQFSLFLTILRFAPLVRFGRRLDALDAARQDAVLRWFEDAPIMLVRSGFWGLRTLIFMGYYGRAEAGPAIGYRPARHGNSFLHDR